MPANHAHSLHLLTQPTVRSRARKRNKRMQPNTNLPQPTILPHMRKPTMQAQAGPKACGRARLPIRRTMHATAGNSFGVHQQRLHARPRPGHQRLLDSRRFVQYAQPVRQPAMHSTARTAAAGSADLHFNHGLRNRRKPLGVHQQRVHAGCRPGNKLLQRRRRCVRHLLRLRKQAVRTAKWTTPGWHCHLHAVKPMPSGNVPRWRDWRGTMWFERRRATAAAVQQPTAVHARRFLLH